MEFENNLPELKSFPIGLDEALEATANWRTWMDENNVPEQVRTNAFFIPMGDLIALVELLNGEYAGAVGVRAYVGMGEPKTGGGSALKLLLVGVGPSPEAIVPDPGIDIIEEIGDTGLVTIYDFTSPCPKFCDASSALLTNK